MSIDEKIESLLPYFRGLSYDDDMMVRIMLLIPNNWNVDKLQSRNLLVDRKTFAESSVYTIGQTTDGDAEEITSIEFLFDFIEETIVFNEEEELKKEKIEEKMRQLREFAETATLDDLENIYFNKSDEVNPPKKRGRKPKTEDERIA